MKRPLVCLPFATLALFATPLAAQTALEIAPGQTLLEIQATGESYAAPDEATLNAGVVTFATTSRQAVADNAREMDRVVKALRATGIPSRDIQTSNISLNPQYNYDRQGGEPPQITGYQANNSVTVRVRNIGKASDYLTAMFEAGANNVNGPYFSLSNAEKATATARTDAVAKAKTEAEAYAVAFGMRIVRVLRISERGQQVQYNPIIVTGSRSSAGAPPPPPPPPMPVTSVSIGEMQQNVTLWVDFVLEPR